MDADAPRDPFDVQPDPDTWAWLVRLAAEHHGGSIAAATAAVRRGARLAETSPDRWAGLAEQVNARTSWPPYRVPVDVLQAWGAGWEQPARRREVGAQEILDDLQRKLAR